MFSLLACRHRPRCRCRSLPTSGQNAVEPVKRPVGLRQSLVGFPVESHLRVLVESVELGSVLDGLLLALELLLADVLFRARGGSGKGFSALEGRIIIRAV